MKHYNFLPLTFEEQEDGEYKIFGLKTGYARLNKKLAGYLETDEYAAALFYPYSWIKVDEDQWGNFIYWFFLK
jgi:hypothetical protein